MECTCEDLLGGPFTRTHAAGHGISSRMLQGKGYERVFPRVWKTRAHEMSEADWVEAARLALPNGARLTGISRLRSLGLDFGPALPIHFVVEGELHLAFENVFLHRTRFMPPSDDRGVSVEAAYLAYCVRARVIDAIKAGDWLLHHGYLDLDALRDLAIAQLWRDGADEALWVLDHLDPESWSLKESETRPLFTFAGLPRPECNQALDVGSGELIVGDLLFREHRVVVEYEGRHHQEDRDQYNKDLDRYAVMRDHDYAYIQVTDEKLRRPRHVVTEVYLELTKRGYAGPPPRFEDRWRTLFGGLRAAVGPRDQWRRSA